MFKGKKRRRCAICEEKELRIAFLERQNKDLYDRLMAFNENAFSRYKAETRNSKKDLFPFALGDTGEIISYKDSNPYIAADEVFRAMCGDPVTVEDRP